ncbi:hypothetical protein J6590_001512 [Homalodisca vitripennis]|nr:hypothetical protein J6590_001512 [Homalodisca vitripennis]
MNLGNTDNGLTRHGTAAPIGVSESTPGTNTTTAETTTAPQPPPEPPNKEKEGRALTPNMTSLPPLDDVTMEEEDSCVEGQLIDRGCSQLCSCVAGTISCSPRQCPSPLVLKGSNADSLCKETPEGNDECCVLLTCAHDAGKYRTSNCN